MTTFSAANDGNFIKMTVSFMCMHGDLALAVVYLPCHGSVYFYASTFRRRRHYVFTLSVHPTESLKYPLSTCTWVCWSIRPTVTVLRHVRPSGEVSRHLPENAWKEWPKILHADVSCSTFKLIALVIWNQFFCKSFLKVCSDRIAIHISHWSVLLSFIIDVAGSLGRICIVHLYRIYIYI